MPFSTAIARPLQLGTRVLQWASAVIVMGLTSYFISLGARGEHILYQEVIVWDYFSVIQWFQWANHRTGCSFGRFLPSSLPISVPAYCAEQICPRHRYHLLIPVCSTSILDRPLRRTNVIIAGWPHLSSPPKTTITIQDGAIISLNQESAATTGTTRRLMRLSSSWLCTSSPWSNGNKI